MNQAPSYRVTRLEDRTFTHGGHVSIPVKGRIPGGRRILGVEMVLDAQVTQPGAGMAAQLGSVLAQLVQKLVIGRRIDIDGLGLTFLNWARRGREYDFPAGNPAGAAGNVFSRRVAWSVEYADYRARDVAINDGALPSELWQDELEIDFAANTVFAATAPTVTGTLRTQVIHDSALGKKLGPTSRQFKSQPFSALSAAIQKRGAYEHAVLYRLASNDPGNISDTQVSAVTLTIDGEVIYTAARVQDLASIYNRTRALGSDFRVESQTVPQSGEALNDAPGVAAGAGLGVAIDFLPLIPAPGSNLGSQAAESSDGNGGFQVDLTGAIGSYRIAYCLAEPRSAEGEAKAAVAQNAPTSDVYLKATRGSPVTAKLRRRVPVKFTPAAK